MRPYDEECSGPAASCANIVSGRVETIVYLGNMVEYAVFIQIGQLKQVVAEVIIVVLFVLFLRVALQSFREPNVEMSLAQIATLALLAVSTMLLALALRLVELHPKPERPGSSEQFDSSHGNDRAPNAKK